MDYRTYKFNFSETLLLGFIGTAVIAMLAWLFYRSVIAFFLLLPGISLIFKAVKRELMERRIRELAMEFKEALLAVQAALNAGYSVENAFMEAGNEMERMYGSEGLITTEFRMLSRRLRSNENLEKILEELADRSSVEDIKDFADVFGAAKRSGGDMSRIIRQTVDHLSGKAEVRREIETLTHAKQFENRIMDLVPLGIILYLGITSPAFLDPLYKNPIGIAIMTFCLFLYVLSLYLSEKILHIGV